MAQADPNILLNSGRPNVQLADPLAMHTKTMQLKGLLGQQQLQQLQLEQASEEAQNQRTLSDLYKTAVNPDGTVDRTRLTTQAAQRGLGSRIPALQKGWAESDKAVADAAQSQTQNKAAEFKLAKDKLDASGAALSALLSRPSVTHDDVIQTVSSMVQNGMMDPQQGAMLVRSLPGRPEALRPYLLQKGLEVMEAGKRMELMLPKTEVRDTGGALVPFQTNQLTGQVTPGAPVARKTMTPGEVASNTLGRERLAFDREQGSNKFIPVEGMGVFVGNPATGQLRPATGTDGQPVKGVANPTEGERKAATLYSRMKFSEQQLQTALGEAPGAAKPSMVTETARKLPLVGESAANTINSQERQRVEAAQLDILDSALTLGTGAAYTREQLEGYRKSYFPQIGDDAKTVADKQARLQNVINAAELAAGRAAGKANAMPGPGNIDALGSGGAQPGISAEAIAAELARRNQK